MRTFAVTMVVAIVLAVAVVGFDVRTVCGEILSVDAGPDQSGVYEGDPLSFHGQATSSGTILEWYWDFDDGTMQTSTDQNEIHSFADEGAYTVELTVQDTESALGSDTLLVTVENAAPTVELDPSDGDGGDGGGGGFGYWYMGGGGLLANPWLLRSVIACAIAIPISIHNGGDDSGTVEVTVDDDPGDDDPDPSPDGGDSVVDSLAAELLAETDLLESGVYMLELSFDAPGVYDVVVTATDEDGAVTNAYLEMIISPEPATLSLLALGGMALLRRRRKQ